MKSAAEAVRNLERLETGEIRRLQCAAGGRRPFASPGQLSRHELECAAGKRDRLDDLKAC